MAHLSNLVLVAALVASLAVVSAAGSKGSCAVTATDIEGPYYKANAPFQPTGPNIPYVCQNTPAYDRVYLNGTVTLQQKGGDCVPVKALLDIWQANADGAYSPSTPGSKDYTCRSRVFTNDDGSYSLSSIFPGRYDDGGYRPAHIHFKITPVDKYNKPIAKPFTTQLYFYEDHYLAPRDSCTHCASGQPSLIAHVAHVSDIKTYVGSWNVNLPAPAAVLNRSLPRKNDFQDKHYNLAV